MSKRKVSRAIGRLLTDVQSAIVDETIRAYAAEHKDADSDATIIISSNKLKLREGRKTRKLRVNTIVLGDRAVLLIMEKKQVRSATKRGGKAKMACLHAEAKNIGDMPLEDVYSLSKPAYEGDESLDTAVLFPMSGSWLANVEPN